MQAEGFAVVGEAVDGASAVELTLQLSPDVVLLDVELPDFDGFEVAVRLALAQSRSAVVLTSSRDRADFGPLVDESPARGFVAKGELSGDAVRELVA